jgi:hypothetical protein
MQQLHSFLFLNAQNMKGSLYTRTLEQYQLTLSETPPEGRMRGETALNWFLESDNIISLWVEPLWSCSMHKLTPFWHYDVILSRTLRLSCANVFQARDIII